MDLARAPASSALLRGPLETGAAALGLTLSPGQLDALLAYLALLQRWNKVYNLTAVRRPEEMLRLHLLDSLSIVPSVRRWIEKQAPVSGRLLDVGSGGGFPGVVLALLCPQLSVTCVDAVGKKATFIRQVGAELGLKNLHVEHARVEALPAQPGYDLITSRAFSSLPLLVSLTFRLLNAGGVWAAMKGQPPEGEIAALPPHVQLFHVEPLQVPGVDAQRCLVWMRATSHN